MQPIRRLSNIDGIRVGSLNVPDACSLTFSSKGSFKHSTAAANTAKKDCHNNVSTDAFFFFYYGNDSSRTATTILWPLYRST